MGDRVFGFAAGFDGAAELAVSAEYAPIPPSLDFAGAAGLPVAVETALRTLDLVGVGAGSTVVINGAAGAVGSSAVQIASRAARCDRHRQPRQPRLPALVGSDPTTYGEGLVGALREIAPDGITPAIDAAGGGALPALVELAGGPEHVVTIADYAGAQPTGVRFTGGPDPKRACVQRSGKSANSSTPGGSRSR